MRVEHEGCKVLLTDTSREFSLLVSDQWGVPAGRIDADLAEALGLQLLLAAANRRPLCDETKRLLHATAGEKLADPQVQVSGTVT